MKYFRFGLLFFSLLINLVIAQENNSSKPASSEKSEEKGENKTPVVPTQPPAPPAPWWNMSAKVNENSNLKFHTEGEIKYTYQGGTLDSHLIETNFLIAFRKKQFTNFIYSDIGFMDATQYFADYKKVGNEYEKEEKSVKILMRKFQGIDIFRTDFTKHLFLDFGLEGFRDDMSYIYSRYTYFTGVGYQFDYTEKQHYSFMVGSGYEMTEYTERSKLPINPEVDIEDTPDSMAGYFQFKGNQQINQYISFHQSLFYTHYLEEDRTDRWEGKFRVMFRMTPKLSMFVVYEFVYEDNTVVDAAGGDKMNTKLTTGLRFSF